MNTTTGGRKDGAVTPGTGACSAGLRAAEQDPGLQATTQGGSLQDPGLRGGAPLVTSSLRQWTHTQH